ncbi:hypothetical protein WN59_11460 [Salinicoccus sediminis]|uniref:Bacterial Pleckstrin homology domain-containing protein n=1 Tax=Salinicoccus sediminis TaxID=1432562 RepID=A0A0M2SLA1_9STAP|nr:hypothetical protein [Salinicoccus sediminis]KKK33365.1 hypothetical protein WN59_11460 [Salinicoccus sediminis]
MIITIAFILFAGQLIKSFYTHYISEKRKYFSFDDRRFTDDDYLKVQDLNIGRLERTFLYIMLVIYVAALLVHLFLSPILSIWLLGAFFSSILLLSMIVDLKLYTVAHDRTHIIMAVIWLVMIIGIFGFLTMASINDSDMSFEADEFNLASLDYGIPYDDIESVEMTDGTPEIPSNHLVMGAGGHLHGTFIEGRANVSRLDIEDTGQPLIYIKTVNMDIYINDSDAGTTETWFEELSSRAQ